MLLALGIGFVTYTGLDIGIAAIKASVISSFGGLPADVFGLMGYLWVDKAVTTVFSAFTAALVIRTASSGAITKMVIK